MNMNRLVRMTLGLGLAALLLACAGQTVYRPAEQRGAEGYAETRLADSRYRVTFSGNGRTPAGTVQDYALLRAAELTLQQGYDWFRVTNQDIERKEHHSTTVDTGFAVPAQTAVYRECGVLTCRTTVAHSPGFDTGAEVSTVTRRSYTSQVELLMRKYPKSDEADAYDARDVVRTLRAAMEKPNQ
jgi:hypothetical protein